MSAEIWLLGEMSDFSIETYLFLSGDSPKGVLAFFCEWSRFATKSLAFLDGESVDLISFFGESADLSTFSL